jgi:choline kinase
VILAAGVGSRLRPLTERRPKALVPLGGRPLIGHALDALAECGVRSLVVVLGHAREALAGYLATRREFDVQCVDNPAYATTNTLASVVCAAACVDGDFLLLDGDLVFEPAILVRLLEPGARLAIDHARPLDDDAVKVALDGHRVAAVGKTLPAGRRGEAESIGLAHIDRATARALLPLCRDLLARGHGRDYYEAAFQRLVERGVHLEATDVTGLRWVEVDDHDDLRRAEAAFVAA